MTRRKPDETPDGADESEALDSEALFDLYNKRNESDEDAPVKVEFRLTRDLDKRLDRYLVDRVPFLSRTAIQRLIQEQAVTVNGRVPKASTTLHRGDHVVAVLPPPPSDSIPAEELPLRILYEDAELIVINKQADIIVHPARGNKHGTLINGLAWHFLHSSSGTLSTVGKEFARPGVVHRLDRHTTGVMVAAKTDTSHWRLGRQFELRQTTKRYIALVHGQVEPRADVIDLPLGKHPRIRERYAVRHDASGKESQTVYRTIESFAGFTLLEVELRTGRTHQIRVHMSHRGYPIAGDDLYGGKHLRESDIDADGTDRPVLKRQALHAALLGFTHPITGVPMTFTAPVWDDMRETIALLRRHRSLPCEAVSGTLVDLAQVGLGPP